MRATVRFDLERLPVGAVLMEASGKTATISTKRKPDLKLTGGVDDARNRFETQSNDPAWLVLLAGLFTKEIRKESDDCFCDLEIYEEVQVHPMMIVPKPGTYMRPSPGDRPAIAAVVDLRPNNGHPGYHVAVTMRAETDTVTETYAFMATLLSELRTGQANKFVNECWART